MIVESTDNELIIRISKNNKFKFIQQALDYLEYQEATSNSIANQDEIDRIAREANKGWWDKNRSKFIK